MLDTAGNLRRQKPSPLRPYVDVMLFGLLASTGLRVSEALNLRLGDLPPGGVLHIRQTKYNKSRLVPMHPSVVEAFYAICVYASGSLGSTITVSVGRRQPAELQHGYGRLPGYPPKSRHWPRSIAPSTHP